MKKLLLLIILITLAAVVGFWRFRQEQATPSPSATPTPQAKDDCRISGCSGEICADTDFASICSFKPEYVCYKTARCEKQQDGTCGWTQTKELTECIKKEKII